MSTPGPDPDATARVDSDARRTPPPRGPHAQFAPGTTVAGRYRIAGILGAGGMGEVYRADDIKLDQAVALKFLPARLERDPMLLARLHDEVRLGRQVAHPNVCRIYDIVEWEGAHFVAMEFVDGEDLARLLRRIGRLAHDKAVDIARGIAAGLLAAHAKGILHRDLKPANVMIDSHGEARIMDFGLALAEDQDDGTISGTPAYMAPEQLEGRPATIQSDLYSLGLVMYELFTGRRAHVARTMPERLRDITSEIATPSSVIRDIDPAVERIILRCLAADPGQRPRSAREVIVALPGGDPLAAAMAAGETPSPRVVAAAGSEGTLRPAAAWGLLAAVVALLAIAPVLRSRNGLLRLSGVTRSPEVMADRAETILRELGLERSGFRAIGYEPDYRYLGWIFANDKSPDHWNRLRHGLPGTIFWLRDEPEPLLDRTGETPGASATSPPLGNRKATLIELDPHGRLVLLTAIPAETWKPRAVDWTRLLVAAGFADAHLERTEPRLIPPAFADARMAWKTRHPDDGTPVRIEAAAFRGTPVFFRIVAPWDEAPDATSALPFGQTFSTAVSIAFLAVAAFALLMAWRNLRLHRGDRTGAFRVAVAVGMLTMAAMVLTAEHALSFRHELEVVTLATAQSLLLGAIYWIIYIAIEPFIRRRWPDRLISWNRLLAGDWRSPMVGRDILIGTLAGVIHGTIAIASTLVSGDINGGYFEVLDSSASTAGLIFDAYRDGITAGMTLMTMLMLMTLVLRRRPLAVGALWLLQFGLFMAASTDPRLFPFFAVIAAVYTFTTARFGLLAASVMHAAFALVLLFPLADRLDAWYTPVGFLTVFLTIAIAIWAFRVALGGQSAFSGALLDDQA